MKHHYLKGGFHSSHWAVGLNKRGILLQVGDDFDEQSRVLLTEKAQINEIIEELMATVAEYETKYGKLK